MPLLDPLQVAELLSLARIHRRCGECGHHTAMDYCRTCDEHFWIHQPGCRMHTSKHDGHRSYLIPFVEVR
jgi:hypothetical protein